MINSSFVTNASKSNGLQPKDAKIIVNEATFAYKDKNIFTDLSFSVQTGEVLCLLGANGCGKTTLLRCLGRHLKLRSGQVFLEGKDIAQISPTALACRVGFVFQDNTATFPYSVLEVVRMGRAPHLSFFSSPGSEDTKIADMVMDNVGISHLRNKRFTEISGGERQLTAIARTLAQQPEVIIMDEPTSALDFKNQALVLRMIAKLAAQGMTIVMSSHFPNNALLFQTTVAMMQGGKFIVLGDANEVITEKNLRQTYDLPVKILTAQDKENGGKYRFVVPMDVIDDSLAMPVSKWDSMAEIFESRFSQGDYRDQMLKKIEVSPTDTVLDVGCGPGTLALPLAAKTSAVTALDSSAGMLHLAEVRAKEQGLVNLSLLQRDWDAVIVGDDVEPHDVVICSRAASTRNPRGALYKMHLAARRKVYLTAKVGGDHAEQFWREMHTKISAVYVERPDYQSYLKILMEMGLSPHIEFIDYTDVFDIDTEEEALQVIGGHMELETEEQKTALLALIRDNMAAHDGSFVAEVSSRWALLSWDRNTNAEIDTTTENNTEQEG